MMKSILAVSEGGPDATMSFRLAARVAAEFDGAVDALLLLGNARSRERSDKCSSKCGRAVHAPQ